jgi:hypothetical protein
MSLTVTELSGVVINRAKNYDQLARYVLTCWPRMEFPLHVSYSNCASLRLQTCFKLIRM